MAKMLISEPLLIQLLELPEGTTLGSTPPGNVELEVSHPSIPEGTEKVLPTWIKKDDKTEFLKFDIVEEGL